MYSKRAVTLAFTLVLLSSYCIIGFDLTQSEKREARLSTSVIEGENDPYIRTRFAGGNGTGENPYQISNVSQLQDMNLDLSANYTLVNDIDASETREWNNGKGFTPIANDTNSTNNSFDGTSFAGSLDGKGYHITDLYINRSTEMFVGLFGQTIKIGLISNITLIDIRLNGKDNVGGIVGKNYGLVLNCSVTGNVTGISDVGGLVGINCDTIQNSSATGNVDGNRVVGGLVGGNSAMIQNCSATGSVKGVEFTGGLVGWNYNGIIKNCSATGVVKGSYIVGGLVGLNDNTVENCYATGDVTGNKSVGGLVGENPDLVKNSYATGDVSGNTSVGGLVGSSRGNVIFPIGFGRIVNSFATGNVTGKASVGGLMGSNSDKVQNCTATGNVDGNRYVGGLVGSNCAIILNGFATGNVIGVGFTGGLVGSNSDPGSIMNSHSTGIVSGANNTGRLVGYNSGIVENDTLPALKFGSSIEVSTIDQNLHREELKPDPNWGSNYRVLLGHRYTITFSIENTGKVDAYNITVNLKMVYSSGNSDLIRMDFGDNLSLIEIKAESNLTLDFDWSPHRYGEYYMMLLTIDPNDEIQEVDKDNNKLEFMWFRTEEKPGTTHEDVDWSSILGPNISFWSVFLLVLCSLLIFFIFIWIKKKAKL